MSSGADAYIRAAYEAGCPRDQLERFIAAGYVAQPVQLKFHAAARACDAPDGPVMVMQGGTRGGAKTHAVMAQVGIDDCQRVPGLKWLYLRKIQKHAREQFEDVARKVLSGVPHEFLPGAGIVRYPNGSRILVGGFRDENDINAYLGIEYDGMVIEEITQLSERKIDLLRGSLRSSRPDWRARLYASGNPGGVGHGYVKRTFVLPYRAGTESLTRFIPSSYKDNAYISPEYRTYLESLTGILRKAWAEGDWDVFEGQAFPSWSYDDHVVEPFEIPDHWVRLVGVDWGYSAPWCALWGARDPDTGRVVIYREAYERLLTDKQQAQRIISMTPIYERISVRYADPSMWAKKSLEGVTSSADVYAANGVYLTKADNDRLSGKRKVDRMLANLPDGRPGLLIFRNCENLIRTLPELVFDQVNVEDVDTSQEDHAYDALRYLLSSVKEPTQKSSSKTVNPWQQNARKPRMYAR